MVDASKMTTGRRFSGEALEIGVEGRPDQVKLEQARNKYCSPFYPTGASPLTGPILSAFAPLTICFTDLPYF